MNLFNINLSHIESVINCINNYAIMNEEYPWVIDENLFCDHLHLQHLQYQKGYSY